MRIQTIGSFAAGTVLTANLAFAAPSFQPGGTPADPDHLALFKLYMAANADVLDKDDKAAWEYHFLFKVPPGTGAQPISPECSALHSQLGNELTAKRLLEAARADFRKALDSVTDWPRTAVFRITTSGSLIQYDASSRSFSVGHYGPLSIGDRGSSYPIPRGANGPGLSPRFRGPIQAWCVTTAPGAGLPDHFALEITGAEALKSVPMAEAAAEAFLNAHPGRNVEFELIVEAGPAVIRPDRSHHQLPVPARLLQARVMDAAGKEIHRYALGAAATTPAASAAAAGDPATAPGADRPAPSASASSASSVVPLNSYRAFLLTVRDNPTVASPAALLPPTRMQVLAEQKAWQTVQTLLDHIAKAPRSDQYKLNPKRKTFIYEWQSADEASRAHLVDVFLRTDADWSFVTREPQWDGRFGSIVDVFLFSRKIIEGRDASFAAQEVIPVYRQHLNAAVAKAPTSFVLTLGVPPSGYDFDSRSIKFLPSGTNVQQGKPYQTGAELLESTDHPKFEELVLPSSAAFSANYHLFGAVRSMHGADPPFAKPGSDVGHTSPTQSWRSHFSIGSSGAGVGENFPYVEVLALDRQLRLTAIPLDPARAEKIAKASHYATMGTISGLTAKAYFDADRVELSWRTVGGIKARFGVLFAKLQRLDIHGPDGELLATFKPENLPAPAARTTTPEPAPAKLPPEQTATLQERQAKINQDVTVKTNATVADLKKRSDVQLTQAAAASAAASQAAQPPDGQSQMSGAPAGPAWQPCGGDLKSGASQTVVPVEFVNASRQPRKLIWFDFAGARVVAGTLQPGQSAPMQTYTTHAWMIADESDKCLGTLVISKAGSIEIR